MNSDLSGLKKGDWVWTIRDGWVKICELSNDGEYLMTTGNHGYDLGGFHGNDKYPSAFLEPPEGFNAEPKRR
jgi:hypothetical protein